ncbi:MAG: sensor histidine kinase [Anaerolineales bacterium]|nr:MAG: sensor histidine kinase [Anaerolineales bacterium]
MSLRTKVTLMILLPAIVIISISSLLHYQSEREDALATMSLLASQTGGVIERAIQRDMLLSDFDHIQTTFDDIGEDPLIGLLLLLDSNGRVIFSPKHEYTGQVLSNQDSSCQPCHRDDASNRPLGIVTSADDGQRFFRSMHPIENRPECNQCHDPDQRIIGVLLTDFSIEFMQTSLTRDLRNNLIWWTGTLLLLILFVNFAVHRGVVNRIDSLHTAMDGFGRSPQLQDLPEGPQDEIGRLRHTFNIMANRISKRDADNQLLSQALRKRITERGQLLKQLITAQEEERIRVARELHDELGQSLSSTALQIEIAKRQLANRPDAPIEHLNQASSILKDATDQMYNLISGLRPSILDDLGLEAAFVSLAKRTLEPAGVGFKLEIKDLGDRLPATIETVVYRVFQEALTNVLRHAKATEVDFKLEFHDGVVHGQLRDNGVGFDPDHAPGTSDRLNRMGVLGMRERVEQCGGEFTLSSAPHQGTLVIIRLPIESCQDV